MGKQARFTAALPRADKNREAQIDQVAVDRNGATRRRRLHLFRIVRGASFIGDAYAPNAIQFAYIRHMELADFIQAHPWLKSQKRYPVSALALGKRC